LQLVNDQIKVLVLNKGVKNSICYDAAEVENKYGIRPSQMIDFKALRGDPCDNIPGVRGIGEKTAVKLLRQFDNLNNLYKTIEKSETSAQDESISPKLQKLLTDQKEQAYLSRFLGLINQDAPIDFDLNECQWQGCDQEAVKVLQEFGFQTLIKRLPELNGEFQKEQNDNPRKNLRLW
jgi:DNA polymerase-1